MKQIVLISENVFSLLRTDFFDFLWNLLTIGKKAFMKSFLSYFWGTIWY